jgi:hypothetical protein
MRSGPDWADGTDDRCHGFAPELIRMVLDCRGTVGTSRAAKSFPPYGRPRERSTEPMNRSSSIIYQRGLLTSIDLARRLRSIRPIRQTSSESNHFLHSTPTYRLAGRIGRRWTIRRSTVGASLACLRLSMIGRSASSTGRNLATRGHHRLPGGANLPQSRDWNPRRFAGPLVAP